MLQFGEQEVGMGVKVTAEDRVPWRHGSKVLRDSRGDLGPMVKLGASR